MYHAGRGGAADPKRALEAFRASCRGGYPGSCVELINRDEPLPLSARRRGAMLEAACKRKIAKACALLKK